MEASDGDLVNDVRTICASGCDAVGNAHGPSHRDFTILTLGPRSLAANDCPSTTCIVCLPIVAAGLGGIPAATFTVTSNWSVC